jgi:glycosyltransferase involved in cell wall biosynthesis
MGVPAVATDVKGNREAIQPGRTGALVPLGNVEELANAVSTLLSDPAQRQQMGCEARRVALECFDEQQVIDRLQVEYARLLRDKRLLGSQGARS